MNTWRLNREGTIEILQRLIELENKVALLECEKELQKELINERLDEAVEQLEPKIVDKCYCRVYDRDFLVKLLEETDKDKDAKS